MRKSQRTRKSRKTHKRRGGWNPFKWFSSDPNPSKEQEQQAQQTQQTHSNTSLPPPIGQTTQLQQKGGIAPINMKEPMFYPTPRQLECATTAGLPTKGGSRRRHMRNKKSKRKSRR